MEYELKPISKKELTDHGDRLFTAAWEIERNLKNPEGLSDSCREELQGELDTLYAEMNTILELGTTLGYFDEAHEQR